MDYDNKARFIIVRVFERGNVEDIRACRTYYSPELFKQALLETKFMMEHRIHLAAAIIDEPIQKFRCYILRQLNPTLFPY